MTDFRRIKTITTYAGHARFLAECEWDDNEDLVEAGHIARCDIAHIPSPYRYSPATQINLWNGRKVILVEVAHRRYEVFEVAPQARRFPTHEAATDYHIRMTSRAA